MSTPTQPGKRPAISAMAAGFQFAVCILLPVWAGIYVDRRQHTHPWGLIAGFALGLVIGTWSVFVPLWRETDTHVAKPRDEDE